MIVSPFAKRNYVSHVVHDHTSILKLIETKWNLGALTYRDANADNLLDSLDLVGPPAFPEPPTLPAPRKVGTCQPGTPADRSRRRARSCPRAGRPRFASAPRPSVAAWQVDVRTRVDGPRADFDPDRFFADDLPAAHRRARRRDHPRALVHPAPPARGRGRRRGVDAAPPTAGASRSHAAPRPDAKARVQLGARAARRSRRRPADAHEPVGVGRARPADAATSAISSTGGSCCAPRSTARRSTRPGSVALDDADGRPLDLASRVPRPTTTPPRCGTSSRPPASCTSRACSTRTRWTRSRPTWTAPRRRYTEGDGRSWWARTADGDDAARAHAGLRPRLRRRARSLDDDALPRPRRRSPGAGHEFGTQAASNRIEALFKPIGVTEGISDIPWHKDCGIGRHSYDCCGLTVGISVTGADAVSGQLWVIAGSHRALVWSGIRPARPRPARGRRCPPRPATSPCTCSCTMHMAQPPVERERRVHVQRLRSAAARGGRRRRGRRGPRPGSARSAKARRSPSSTATSRVRKRYDCVLEFDPLDEYPIHQVPLPMRYVATQRPQRVRPLHLPRRRSRSRRVLHHRPGRVPEPRRDRRVRDRAPRRQAVGDPHVGRAARRQDEPAGRSVPHRGDQAVPASCASSATPTTTASASTSRTGRSTARSPSRSTFAARATASCSTRRASPASARGKASCASTATPIAVTPDRYTATRDRSWGIRPVGEAEPPGRPERLHRHVVVLDPAAVRRLRDARHPRRRPRRAAQHELRGARVARKRSGTPRRSNSAGRCPRSATCRAPAIPTRRVDRAHEPRRQEVDARDRAAHRHPAERRLRLRRRPRLDARRLEGRRLGRGLGLRLQRSRGDRPGRVLVVGPRRPGHASKATRATASSSTACIGPHAPCGFTELRQTVAHVTATSRM